jgi:hypothetical protein
MATDAPRTKTILARRVHDFDTLIVDGQECKVSAIESIDYGAKPEQTTIYAGMHILHFWYDEKVTVLRR